MLVAVKSNGSIATSLARGLREERFDDLLQVRAPAFRAVQLLRVVLLDAQHFVEFLVAFAAAVFVERHGSCAVVGGVFFQRKQTPCSRFALPSRCQKLTVI